jgi:hypothetical protein
MIQDMQFIIILRSESALYFKFDQNGAHQYKKFPDKVSCSLPNGKLNYICAYSKNQKQDKNES